jgi:TonB-linked SusC/RagA family outer membrane protein
MYAQRTITGSVVDEEGEPLIGAAVQVKGTTKGVITDFDGNFTIEVPSGSDIIVFSYIGYTDQEYTLGASNVVDIVLQPDSEIIETVEVIGYKTATREETVGSVGKVGSEKIEGVPLATFDQTLQGQTAGLAVFGGSGQPGSSAGYVQIRGPGSINGSNTPLYLMDGIQISAGDFNTLNPNDIESVSVLKDAASTAIYGSRGANGVILITTKRGSSEKVNYTYRGQFGVADFTTGEFNMMNSTQKLAFEEAAMRGPGWINSRNNPANAGLPEDQLMQLDATLDSLRGINTNWRDILFQDGKTHMHELAASGGNKKTTFYVSGSYFDQEGQFIESRLKRGTGRFNITHRASDHVEFGLNATMGYSQTSFIAAENAVNLNNPFAFAYLANPYEQVWLDEEAGIYQFGATGRNPFEDVNLNTRDSREFKGVAATYMQISFLKNFKFRTQFGIDYRNNNGNTYISPLSRLGLTVTGSEGSLARNMNEFSRWTTTNTLNWAKRFGEDHRIDVLVGQEFIATKTESFNFTGYGVDPDIQTPAGITNGNPNLIPVVGGGLAEKNISSLFARADYSFKDRYNFSAGIRRDGSSGFGRDNQFGTFWNAGASWIISREDFLANNSTINFLKVYINYGTLGNDALGFYDALGAFNNVVYNGVQGIAPDPTAPPNPALQWEVSKQLNIGAEFGLWNDRVSGEFALYRNDTEDLFVPQQLSRTTGSTQIDINSGRMRNQGVEIELNFELVKTKDFYLNLGGNFTYNYNEVLDLGQVTEFEQGTEIVREGQPLGSHFVTGWAGVDPATGDPLYLDSLQNVTNVFSPDNALSIWGTWYPPFIGGVNLEVGYKGFRLALFGNWTAQRTLFNNQTFFQENPNFAQFNQFSSMDVRPGSASRDIWIQPGDIAQHQRIESPRQFSSKDLEDASFFRLRNVRLSYSFSSNVLGNTLNDLMIFVQAQNLLTFTKFSGFDPEISNNIAQYEYPAQRTYTVGVQVGF